MAPDGKDELFTDSILKENDLHYLSENERPQQVQKQNDGSRREKNGRQNGREQESGQVRDPDREFFKLTLLAAQLNHPDFQAVKSISMEELFHEAKEVQRLPFHQFQGFIAKEIDKFYLLKTKNADPDRFLGREEELEEYNGATLYVDIGDVSSVRTSMLQVSQTTSPRLGNLLNHSIGLDSIQRADSVHFKGPHLCNSQHRSRLTEIEEGEQYSSENSGSQMVLRVDSGQSCVSFGAAIVVAAVGTNREPPMKLQILDIEKQSSASSQPSERSKPISF